jgi:hypothetical protein
MRRVDNLTTLMRWLYWNLGSSTSWNPQGLSRPVKGLLYLDRSCVSVASYKRLRLYLYVKIFCYVLYSLSDFSHSWITLQKLHDSFSEFVALISCFMVVKPHYVCYEYTLPTFRTKIFKCLYQESCLLIWNAEPRNVQDLEYRWRLRPPRTAESKGWRGSKINIVNKKHYFPC